MARPCTSVVGKAPNKRAFILLIGSFFITFFGLKQLGVLDDQLSGWGVLVETCKSNAENIMSRNDDLQNELNS